MNMLRNLLGVLALTAALVATAASAQGVRSERETFSRQDATIPDRSDARHPTKAKKSDAGARGSRAFANAPGERSPSARSQAASAAFNGEWSVVIYTQSGACDRAFRYGVRIENGEILNAGSEAVALDGRVAPNGAVRVRVAAGGQEAQGAGRLSRSSGGGTWRGVGSAGTCAGTWVAERRG